MELTHIIKLEVFQHQVLGKACALLTERPDVLGIKPSAIPEGLKWKRLLGSGRTSVVHEVVDGSSTFALKVPKSGYLLEHDFFYLTLLCDVDGIPKIHGQAREKLILYPVGCPLSHSNVQLYGLKGSFGELVDVLQAAHAKMIVNRDIRIENIMIAKSVVKASQNRFFILDWGYATNLGIPSKFCGCLYTASDNVLQQCAEDGQVAYKASDDLVALVRCMAMFYSKKAATVLGIDAPALDVRSTEYLRFWKGYMDGNVSWKQAEGNAINCKYDDVKKFLEMTGDFL